MKLRRVCVQNVRSVLERQELLLEGDTSILIGPNGGGKTNLQDAIATTIRKYILRSWFRRPTPQAAYPYLEQFEPNDMVNQMVLERHSLAPPDLVQSIDLEFELTKNDVENIRKIKEIAPELIRQSVGKYTNHNLERVLTWPDVDVQAGQRFEFSIRNNGLAAATELPWQLVRSYLEIYDIANQLSNEFGDDPLTVPIILFPTTRAASGFASAISLASFNEAEYKKGVDAAHSKSTGSLVGLAIGRIATKYRKLLEDEAGGAMSTLRSDPDIEKMTAALAALGYGWSLETQNFKTNTYDVRLTKQGSSFLVGSASSGEKELLTYIFAVYGMNIRDALIIVDEPELHLHPRWQNALLSLFEQLSRDTGNQFLLATHSPTFVSPQSIKYVSRVYSDQQRTRIKRLDDASLPHRKHLFSIVNSQNNERIFFTSRVILVEGISDRIFFERLLRRELGSSKLDFEVVAVGGKHLFAAYANLLKACAIDYAIVADLDYASNIGPAEVKSLFALSARRLKEDVFDNEKSQDAASFLTRLDDAILSGNMHDLRLSWEYIKGRQLRLKLDLTTEARAELDAFIVGSRENGVLILSKGDLEDYLPQGLRSKDMEKLISFLDQTSWWKELSEEARQELQLIQNCLLKGL